MKIWTCKIGEIANVPAAGDAPLRDAVVKAYRELTGQDDDFIFSGWGGELTEGERTLAEADRLSKYTVGCCTRGAQYIKYMTAKEADRERFARLLVMSRAKVVP